MQDELTGGSLGGEVEVDETFIGEKARNMHTDRKRRAQKEGRNTGGKAIVMAMLERSKIIRATVIPDRTTTTCSLSFSPMWNPALRFSSMSTEQLADGRRVHSQRHQPSGSLR